MSHEKSRVDNPEELEEAARYEKYIREIDFADYLKSKKNNQRDACEINFGSYLSARKQRHSSTTLEKGSVTKK